MIAKLTLAGLALTAALPVLAQTTATITGGPAVTCADPAIPTDGSTTNACPTGDLATTGDEHGSGSDDDDEDGED